MTTIFKRVPSMLDFCQRLHTKFTMNEESFTETDYYQRVEEMLFNCRDIERLRLNLPFQLVGRHCNASTMILANTFKAFASRPEEDSAQLKVLVLENFPDIAMCHLWMNPTDVMNIMRVLEALEHLVITLRRHEGEPQRAALFGSCLWNMIENAEQLKTLCFTGLDQEDRPPRGLKQTKSWQTTVNEWRARSLPARQVVLSHLTCLELKRVEVLPQVLLKVAENFGATLEELYLNEVYLKAEQSRFWNDDSKKVLWIGLPNERPLDDCQWIAMELRCNMPKLRICRAAFLGYDHYINDDSSRHPEFDLVDPCGLGRSVSQRFVEVVTGIRQPDMPSGQTVEYYPKESTSHHLLNVLEARTRALRVTEYDTNAYQTAVDNTTSRWHKGLDGIFPNCNPDTLDKLHYIAETACSGMNQIHERRHGGTDQEHSMAMEYANNLDALDDALDDVTGEYEGV